MIVRFGAFEFDPHSGDLRKNGLKVRVTGQPLQILMTLLERPNEVVTREELRQKLWPADTFVDFDVSLSSAVRKLREALEDSADRPQFVETVPRRGYRFIAAVSSAVATPDTQMAPVPPVEDVRVPARWRSWPVLAAVATVAIIAVVFWRVELTSAPPRISPDAYAAYMKGVEAAGRQTYEGFRSAAGYFEDAVAREPRYAAAWSRLAQVRMQFVYGSPLSPRQVVPQAEAAARRAIEIDPSDALAHRVLGTILHTYYWQWDAGNRELRRARELEHDSADAHAMSSGDLIRNGRFREGVAEAERSKALDPRSVGATLTLAAAYREAGEYQHALDEIDRALLLDPQRPRVHFQRGVTLIFMNRPDDAIAALETATKLSAGNPRFEAYLAYALAVSGRRDEARRKLDALLELAKQVYVSRFGIAVIYDALGDKEAALAALQRAVEDHAVELSQPAQYPPFRALNGDPRLAEVLRPVGRIS